MIKLLNILQEIEIKPGPIYRVIDEGGMMNAEDLFFEGNEKEIKEWMWNKIRLEGMGGYKCVKEDEEGFNFTPF